MLVSRFLVPAPVAMVLALGLTASACSSVAIEAPSGDLASTAPDDTAADATNGTAANNSPDGASQQLNCDSVSEDPVGKVQRVELTEASGVVASRRHDGVLWSHNDSGGRAGVFAFDTEGNDLGFFELTMADQQITAVDIEDIAIHDGSIYLADIGDNARARETVTIYVFDEPTPGVGGTVETSETITARYVDGPTDAEALLVDPVSKELIILGKDIDDGSAPTIIYSLRPPPGSTEVAEITRSGSLDVTELTRRSSAFSLSGLAFPGSATAADITDDGSLIAMRTYGSVWLFARAPGTTVAEALATRPCEGGAEAETQGESVGFLPPQDDGLVRYVTISEGRNPPINQSVIEATTGG